MGLLSAVKGGPSFVDSETTARAFGLFGRRMSPTPRDYGSAQTKRLVFGFPLGIVSGESVFHKRTPSPAMNVDAGATPGTSSGNPGKRTSP